MLLGAAAHCKAPDRLETKNSINYLEIRMDVFLFQRTPLHLFVSILLFQLQGHPGGVQEPNSSFSFCAHREVNTIFLACCNCRCFLFCFFACGASDSLASQASALVGIQENIEELRPGGSLINRYILRTINIEISSRLKTFSARRFIKSPM